MTSEYIQWVYEDLKSKNPRSLLGLFYKLFAKQETAARFLSQKKINVKTLRECPVCGFSFEVAADTYCPKCEFNCISQSSEPTEVEKYNRDIAKYKKIWLLPEITRKQYKNELEKALLQNFGNFNFDITDCLSELDNKYGLTETIEESNYIDLAIFGDKAVKLSALLVKGKRVLILGALKQERWETDENEKRSKITIRVAGVILLNDRNGYKENEN